MSFYQKTTDNDFLATGVGAMHVTSEPVMIDQIGVIIMVLPQSRALTEDLFTIITVNDPNHYSLSLAVSAQTYN